MRRGLGLRQDLAVPLVSCIGTLFVEADRIMLCTIVHRSYPPQGGGGIEVRDLDITGVPMLHQGDTTWSEGTVLVRGYLDGQVLVAQGPPHVVTLSFES
jgi:hypothetical protein